PLFPSPSLFRSRRIAQRCSGTCRSQCRSTQVSGGLLMDARWQPGCIPAGLPGAWVVLQGPGGFLLDAQGPLFPDAWVGEQGLATVAEYGLGYYDTVPVYLRQLADQPDLPGCQWQSLRQHLLHGDAKYAALLGYAG